MNTPDVLTMVFGAALVPLAVAALLARVLLAKSEGEDRALQIADAIREGAFAYLQRQTAVITVATALLALLLLYAFTPQIGFGFVYGAATSAIAGFIGMSVAVRSNSRTAHAAEQGLDTALTTAFTGGAIMGLLMEGLALFTLSTFFMSTQRDPSALVGLAFGASLTAIFTRIGGGIYTKGADVGADLVSTLEERIPDNDARNPGVIADSVGDNVGDGAGMITDLFQTYLVGITGAVLLGASVFPHFANAMMYPLALAGVGAIASVVGVFFVKRGRKKSVTLALYKAVISSVIVAAAGFYPITITLMAQNNLYHTNNLYAAALTGLVTVGALLLANEYYTSRRLGAVQHLARVSSAGHGTNIISGLALSMKATLAISTILVVAALTAAHFAGLYGIGLATVSMLSLAGIIAAIDAYVPITDNAASIAEMAKLSETVRSISTQLEEVTGTAKGIAKVYATGTASLAAVSVFIAFMLQVTRTGALEELTLAEPTIIMGLLLGAALPFFFSALMLEAVGKTAYIIVGEIRRQFKEMNGLREGDTNPHYSAAVDIATKASLTHMILPALIPVLVPLIVGTQMGPVALSALVLGTIISGILLTSMMIIGGAAWQHAKRTLEKDSPAYTAAVTGNIVGEVYTDTSGPALSPMMKVVAIIALLLAPLFV